MLIALFATAFLAQGNANANYPKPIPEGPFQPTWKSLEIFKVPNWYQEGKFGIFIHWGVYSVPAFGSEWYPRNMYTQGSAEYKHHIATYGPQSKFGYKDFIPMFKAQDFNPGKWAKLFKDAGAKFVVPVAEHHDGFAMYKTSISLWNAYDMGPHKDIIGLLSKAVRKEGLVFGLSSHRAEHWFFFHPGRSFDSDVNDPRYANFYGPAQSQKSPPNKQFLNNWLARCEELVDLYHPNLFWFDWWINTPQFKPYLQKFAAYYYNSAAKRHQQVAINYKYNAFPAKAAVLDLERGELDSIQPTFWQTDTSISDQSWGYIKGDHYKPPTAIIDELVDIVSKNGALLLNIGPKSDGTIPKGAEDVLLSIGSWLKENGDGIYGTHPWKVFGEGPTHPKLGSFTDSQIIQYTNQDFRFTAKGNNVFAIDLANPGSGVTIHSMAANSGVTVKAVSLTGYHGKLSWNQTPAGLEISLSKPPVNEAAYEFVVEMRAK